MAGSDGQDQEDAAATVHDITELRLLRKQFTHHLLHDQQTGLPNRQYFISHLTKVLELRKPSAVVTLLHVNLDGFSVINDGLGYRSGDRVLDLVARRLESVVAGYQAMVARLAQDEYAILIQSDGSGPKPKPGPEPGSEPELEPDIGGLAEAVHAVLAEPFSLDGLRVVLTATIGIVQQQVARAEPAELLRAAGITLRRSRRSGGQRWARFDPDVDGRESTELRLAAALPGALEDGHLRVDYQSVVSLDSGRVTGAEPVLGWQHPELGALPHEQCVQLAQRTSAVHTMARWLLLTAVHQARSWQDQLDGEPPPVVLDLTPHQARDPELGAQVTALLAQTGMRAHTLELRVPVTALCTVEGAWSGASGEAEHNVRALAALGVRMALHSFDGSLDGLGCLGRLPVYAVRIAPSLGRLVAGGLATIQAQALRALVTTLRNAGIRVTACHVDTEQLADWWRSAGAESAVGLLFGPPTPPQDIEWLLGGIPAAAHSPKSSLPRA